MLMNIFLRKWKEVKKFCTTVISSVKLLYCTVLYSTKNGYQLIGNTWYGILYLYMLCRLSSQWVDSIKSFIVIARRFEFLFCIGFSTDSRTPHACIQKRFAWKIIFIKCISSACFTHAQIAHGTLCSYSIDVEDPQRLLWNECIRLLLVRHRTAEDALCVFSLTICIRNYML